MDEKGLETYYKNRGVAWVASSGCDHEGKAPFAAAYDLLTGETMSDDDLKARLSLYSLQKRIAINETRQNNINR